MPTTKEGRTYARNGHWILLITISIVSPGIFNMPQKSYNMGLMTLLPSKGSCAKNFIPLKSPLLSAGFEPMNLGSNGKHDNHYTTEND
jgi:hypothetical protein